MDITTTTEGLTAGLTAAERSKLSRCFETEPINLIALGVAADDQRQYMFSYTQYLYSESSANPALEDKPDAPPQRLEIHFTVGTVAIVGCGLEPLARAVQKGELKSVWRLTKRSLDPNSKTHVNSVTVAIHQKQIDNAPASNGAGQ
jgi:hypothetical protein